MRLLNALTWLIVWIGVAISSTRAEDVDFCSLDRKAQLYNIDLQRALIATGLLNADAGLALTVEVRRAFARLVFRQDEPVLESLTTEQCITLRNLYQDFQNHAQLEQHLLGMDSLRLLLPGIFKLNGGLRVKADDKNRYWDGDTIDWSFGFDSFQQFLAQTTPLVKQSENDYFWRDLHFFYRLSTATETFSEGIGVFRHRIERMDRDVIVAKRYLFYHRIFEHQGQTKGVYLKFAIRPPDWFDVPPFLSAALSNRQLVESVEKKYDASGQREVAWLLYAEALSNLIGSWFAVNNSMRVLVNPVDQNGGISCDEGGALDSADRRRLRLVFATTRGLKSRLASSRSLTGDAVATGLADLFGHEGDPNGELHIGCGLLETILPGQRNLSNRQYKSETDIAPIDVKVKEITLQKGVARIHQPYLVLADDRQCDEKKPDRRALLYIHGYNNSFSYAIEQAARLAIRANYRGKLFVFSWPSHGEGFFSGLRYFREIDKAEAAQPALQNFLNAILHDSNINTLDIVAHSMGTLQTLRSLEGIRHLFDRPIADCREPDKPNSGRLRLGQVILASPDVDSDVFVQKVSYISRYAERVTVYVSRTDCVLSLSGTIRGVDRAGAYNTSSGPVLFEPKISQRVHVIDTTPEAGPWRSLCRDRTLGHTDYANDPLVRQDIARVLDYKTLLSRRRSPPEVRYQPDPHGPNWPRDVGVCAVTPVGGGPAYWVIRRRDTVGKMNCPPPG